MKRHNPDLHLTYDELLRAMTDPSELDATRQAHLKSCLHCRRETDALTHRYRRLGQMARQMAPKPQQAFRVPARHAAIGRWHFKPGMALGVLGVMIFMFTLWGPRFTGDSTAPVPMVAQNFENDDRLMEEIDAMVEDALPDEYQQLAALSNGGSVSERRSVEDLDEFIDWIVPIPEEEVDVEQPATTEPDKGIEPLARSDWSAHVNEGMV